MQAFNIFKNITVTKTIIVCVCSSNCGNLTIVHGVDNIKSANILRTCSTLNTDIKEEDPSNHHKHVETPKLPHFLKRNGESGEE
jgi:hypothetical protein